jgi:hypothetical protein
MKRIVLAAIVGGLVFFIWSAAIHMSPLGMIGFSNLPDEDAVLDALRTNVTQSGLYFFPGETEPKAWEEKLRRGPTGIMAYTAGGVPMFDPMQLAGELLSDIVAAFIAACIIAMITATYLRRVAVVALMGVFGWVSMLMSYWIWYRFPTSYILMEGVTEIVGWTIAGLVMAKMVVPRGA